MRVLKFGGSSLKTAASVKQVIKIIKHKKQLNQIAVVVSAFSGVTDQILSAIQTDNMEKRNLILSEICKTHFNMAEQFLSSQLFGRFTSEFTNLLHPFAARISDAENPEIDERTADYLLSFGEKMSALLIRYILNAASVNAVHVHADECLITDSKFGYANVLFSESRPRVKFLSAYISKGITPVITGFIGRTMDGYTTTLGRNGSDYSATALASLLKADIVEIWTDSDGILSADPQIYSKAKWISRLSINEAKVLSGYKNDVLHSRTIEPLELGRIPMVIKNVYNPHHDGTLITVKQEPQPYSDAVKSIVIEKDLSLITINISEQEENSFLNTIIKETLQRLALPELVYWDHGKYTVAVPEPKKNEFVLLLGSKLFHHGFNWKIGISVSPNTVDFIGLVGDNIHQYVALNQSLEQFFPEQGIQAKPIHLNPKKHTLEYIGKFGSNPPLEALHSLLFAPEPINLVIAGITGKVGRSLVELLNKSLFISPEIPVNILGAINSTTMVFKPNGIPVENIYDELNRGKERDGKEFLNNCLKTDKQYIFVDVTPAKEIVDFYEPLLLEGIPVVTANKIANSADGFYYDQIRAIRKQLNIPMLYETNVGAATPIIELIQQLNIFPDSVVKIEAVLSGTLSFLFSKLNEGISFSEAVREAIHLGYCEANPLTDLKGVDAVRKLLILLREIGKQLEISDIDVEELVPKDLEFTGNNELVAQLKEMDHVWDEKVREARNQGQKLVYLAVYENNRASIKVKRVSLTDVWANTSFSENVFKIYIKGFESQPLTLIGAGAGPEWTAYGVLKDVVKAWGSVPGQKIRMPVHVKRNPDMIEPETNIGKEAQLEYLN